MPSETRPSMECAVIAYDQGALGGDAASRDVVEQIRAVEDALRRNRVNAVRIGVDLNLSEFGRRLDDVRPDVVFNLVESLDGSDRMQVVVPMLLENWRIPFTGCGSLGMMLSNDKLETKRLLLARGLPAAECAWLGSDGKLRFLPGEDWCLRSCDCIVKAVESHASVNMDDSSVLRGVGSLALANRLRIDTEKYGSRHFAERFIDGREFNLSLIEREDGGADVFPVAEITFADMPPERERIVGYAAKWDEESVEYKSTPRTFSIHDPELTTLLRRQSLAVWEAFGFSGYCRVDFRVDEAGRPFVLEANANPCLHPGSGFASAALRGGMPYEELVMRLGRLAMARCK